MLTKHTNDNAALVLLNIITICLFIAQFLIETLYEILCLIMAFSVIYAMKLNI